MRACRADLRRFRAHNNVSAIAAFPDLDLALGKNLGGFHVVKQRTVALLMVFFDRGDKAEFVRELMEALLIGGLGKTVVHVRPLVILALGGVKEVLRRIADAVELFKPELCMLLFVVGGFQEERGDLLVAFLLCFAYKERILVAGFRFAGEGGGFLRVSAFARRIAAGRGRHFL